MPFACLHLELKEEFKTYNTDRHKTQNITTYSTPCLYLSSSAVLVYLLVQTMLCKYPLF